jgi:hypothetical protein
MGTYEEIVTLMKSDGEIPRSQVTEWMKSSDLRVLGVLNSLTERAYHRIKPELGMETTCNFMLDYYTRCIVEDPRGGDYIHNRYEAGLLMSAWIKHLWNKRPATWKMLEKIQETLAEVYLIGDVEVQGSIIYAILEHVFADEDMLILFKGWKKKLHLREAYDLALDLAKSHSRGIPENVLNALMDKGKS